MLENLKLKAGIQDNPDQEGLDLFAQLVIDECCNAVSNGHSWKSITLEEIRRHFKLG